ncbi:MAG: hypothetical protein ACTSRH_10345 [Promethearchaeota archaeon]
MENIRKISEHVYLFEDFVNIYVIKEGNEAIIIDFGSGNVLNFLTSINITSVDYEIKFIFFNINLSIQVFLKP